MSANDQVPAGSGYIDPLHFGSPVRKRWDLNPVRLSSVGVRGNTVLNHLPASLLLLTR